MRVESSEGRDFTTETESETRQFRKILNGNLSAIEETLFVGGSVEINGTIVNSEAINNCDQLTDEYLVPRNILNSGRDVDSVNEKRQEGYITGGHIMAFNTEWSEFLEGKGFEIAIKTLPVNSVGSAPLMWEVYLAPSSRVDAKKNVKGKKLEKEELVSLMKEYKDNYGEEDIFSRKGKMLQFADTEGGLMLEFRRDE